MNNKSTRISEILRDKMLMLAKLDKNYLTTKPF